MKRPSLPSAKHLFPFILTIALGTTGCVEGIKETGELPRTADPYSAYAAAVRDAESAEPWEISRNLKAINPQDPRQFWSNDGVDDHILVLTWNNWRGYTKYVGQRLKQTNDLWVTVVPDVQNFCHDYQGTRAETKLRLKQLLGLPASANRRQFVEIWVKPEDMFRPTPDPEINDHEAELDFRNARNVSVPNSYKKWFNTLRSTAYGKDQLTWTRLGYTYDWGNTQSHIGPSEFVVRAGSTVTVHEISSLQEYCR